MKSAGRQLHKCKDFSRYIHIGITHYVAHNVDLAELVSYLYRRELKKTIQG